MEPRPERWGWWAIGAVALALWAARVLPELGPGPPDGVYNSDSAIPVLMSNLATGAPLDWLYWGQDRFGGWPFLVARALAWPFGAAWTPHRLHVFHALLWLSALFPWARLAGERWILASVAFLVLPAANPILARTLVDLGHVDAWQLAMLVWAWWGLRCAAGASHPAGALAGASLAAALATWSSLTSAPLLLALALLEGARLRSPWRRRLLLLAPPVVGVAVEWFVRQRWHTFVRMNGWRDVRTPARLDLGHLIDNGVGIARTALHSHALPWLIALLALGMAAAWRLRPDPKQPTGPWTAVGATLCSAIGLLLVVAVRHVRDNGYAARYLGLPLALSVLGLGLLADAGVRAILVRLSVHAPQRVLALGGLAALAVLLPAARPDPREQLLRPVAAALAARFPGAVLVDSYWHSYAVAALAPPGALVPLPAEGEWDRRPDWVPLLGSGRPVLVGNQGLLAHEGAVPAERTQYGFRLWLVEPGVLLAPPQVEGNGPDHLSLYTARPPAQ